MSAYIQFFIRGDKDAFYPIGTYCRSSTIYGIFENFIPDMWGYITPVTDELLNGVLYEVRTRTDDFYEAIGNLDKKIEEVRKFENVSLAERMDLVEDYMEMKNEYRRQIEELEHCKIFISILRDMLDEAESTEYYDEVETIYRTDYVYVGIEVGFPTSKNIKISGAEDGFPISEYIKIRENK